jgi:hypothetical protein
MKPTQRLAQAQAALLLALPIRANPLTTTDVLSPAPTPPATTPITATPLDLPHPWSYATISLVPDPSGDPSGCLASMTARSALSCGRRTSYSASTTVPYAVNCLGCASMTLDYRGAGGCPLGGKGRPPGGVLPGTHTAFSFYCAAISTVGGGFGRDAYRDRSVPLPLPTLPPDFDGGWRPTAAYASVFAEGWCYNSVQLGPTDAGVEARECAATPSGARPTAYTATVTRTVVMGCGECAQGAVAVEGTYHACETTVEKSEQQAVVTAATPTTVWTYACSPTSK